jgi:predicted  nucleic acid-binding Zn-ribbon protein
LGDPTTFAYAVLKAIQDRIKLTQEAILQGGVKDMESYRQLVGELKGLEFSEQEVKDALQESEKELYE